MSSAAPPTAQMLPNLRSFLFLGVMLTASLATMLRMVFAAWWLPTSEFAGYATISAAGAFLSTIISFGAVEATIKEFPRLVVDGRHETMLEQARAILKRLILRAALAGIPLFVAGELLQMVWLKQVGIAFLYALAAAYAAIVASMQRASGNPVTLAAGTVLRSVGVLIAVVLAARLSNLTGVLAAEIAATALCSLASEILFFSSRRSATVLDGEPVQKSKQSLDAGAGTMVFIAFSLVAAPFYLDRLFVSHVMGPGQGAQYAVLAVFLTAASLLVNTLAQRAGPDAIRLVHHGDVAAAVRQISLWSVIASVAWLLAMAAAAIIVTSDLLPEGFARYRIAASMLVPIAVSGILLNTGLLEFLLIALDGEKKFVRCAITFAGAAAAAAILVTLTGWKLPSLLWLLVLCRAIYASALLLALRSRIIAHRAA